ncbi:MAG: antibiotic biosynthesis monooxygenase [bacterium]|nr:antibiotic biosynthesis monooxygenase [bacterium]
MIAKIAEFTVKAEALEHCLEIIEDFIQHVRVKEPGTLFYRSYQMPDRVSFLHVMEFEDKTAAEHHRSTPHVKAFVKELYPLCEEEPEFTDIIPVVEE